MVLLQTILVLIIVYYILKFLWKWLAPRLLNYAVRKTEERFGQQFNTYTKSTQESSNEGDTVVVNRAQPRRKATKKVGEYIDFEEIE